MYIVHYSNITAEYELNGKRQLKSYLGPWMQSKDNGFGGEKNCQNIIGSICTLFYFVFTSQAVIHIFICNSHEQQRQKDL